MKEKETGRPAATGSSHVCLRWATIPLAALMISACADANRLTGLETAQGVPLSNVVDLSELILDSQERIVPYMLAGVQRDEMAASLSKLSRAISTGYTVPVQSALSSARAAVDRFAAVLKDDTGALADLDAIRISLGVIAAQVTLDTGAK